MYTHLDVRFTTRSQSLRNYVLKVLRYYFIVLTDTERPLNISISLSMALAAEGHRTEGQFRYLKLILRKLNFLKFRFGTFRPTVSNRCNNNNNNNNNNNLMEYITLCLDSTNEVEQRYVRHNYSIALYHTLRVSTYIQVIFRPSFTGESIKRYTCRDPIMLTEVKIHKNIRGLCCSNKVKI